MFISFLFFSLVIPSLECQDSFSTRTLPPSDPVFDLLYVLKTEGIVRDLHLVQGPLSEREVRRVLKVARSQKLESDLLTKIDRQMRRFPEPKCQTPDFKILAPRDFTFQVDTSNSSRNFRQNRLGYIQAKYDPLRFWDEGRKNFKGTLLAFETNAAIQSTRYLYTEFEPRFEYERQDAPSDTKVEIFPRRLYSKFAYRNFEFSVGRDYLTTGLTPNGGLLASSHPRPLDHIKLSSVSPFYHPWIFKYLGPSKYTFAVGNLGQSQKVNRSYFLLLKIDFSPCRFFEFGFGRSFIFGGQGGPDLTPVAFLKETFWFPENFKNEGGGNNFTDQRWQFNMQAHFPFSFPFSWYSDWGIDDSRQRMFASLENIWNYYKDQVALQTGLFFPKLFTYKVSTRLEYAKIPALFYRHGIWRDGYTSSGAILGDPQGQDSKSIRSIWNIEVSPLMSSQIHLYRVWRRADRYAQLDPAPGKIRRLVKTIDYPDENSWVVRTKNRFAISKQWSAETELGLEYAQNFEFTQGDDEILYRAGVQFKYQF